MRKYIAIALTIITAGVAWAAVEDFIIPSRGDSGKVIIAPKDASGNLVEVIEVDENEALVKAGKTLDVGAGNLQIDNIAITSTAGELNQLASTTLGALAELDTVDTAQIDDDAIVTGKIENLTIVDADISATADITATKLGTGVVDNTEFNKLNGLTADTTELNQLNTNTFSAKADFTTNGLSANLIDDGGSGGVAVESVSFDDGMIDRAVSFNISCTTDAVDEQCNGTTVGFGPSDRNQIVLCYAASTNSQAHTEDADIVYIWKAAPGDDRLGLNKIKQSSLITFYVSGGETALRLRQLGSGTRVIRGGCIRIR